MTNIEPFKPNSPWQATAFLDKSDILLFSGKPGGGKSHLAGNKVHAYLLRYPGATGVASRKKREDMDQSTIPMFLDEIININEEPRCRFHARSDRVIYEHSGGRISELYFKGMFSQQQREAWKSLGKKGDLDIVLMEEANEYEEEDYNYVTMRTRGTSAPWSQVILATNPDHELHWINVRLIEGGEAVYYYSDWTMNPALNREKYTRTMSQLTGVARQRFWVGDWTSGIGRVIDTWVSKYHKRSNPNPDYGNVILGADYISEGGDVVWVVDDGYSGKRDDRTGYFKAKSNPRAFLLAQKRPDDRLAFFAEHYEVQKLYQPHIREVTDMCIENGWPAPVYVVYDIASPTLGRYLKEAGFDARAMRVKIDEGLDELRNWVGPDTNAVRRMIVHPRLSNLRREMMGYTINAKTNKPIDAFNHGIDAARYLTFYIGNGEPDPVSIEVPGVDFDEIEEKVRRIMAEADIKSKKILESITNTEKSHGFQRIPRNIRTSTKEILPRR